MSFFQSLFGNGNTAELKKLDSIVVAINALEPELEQLDDREIRSRWEQTREMVQASPEEARAAQLDEHLPLAFACVREMSKRTLGLRHFDVQLLGGIVLHRGTIAEMRTGEGKTLVATLPLALNALVGAGAHLVTPNDYLAKTGVQWMGPVYHGLGLSVAAIGQQGQSWRFVPTSEQTEEQQALTHPDWPTLVPITRNDAYAADITYGTNNEFGFDYLRDHMVLEPRQLVQRGLAYAIVDEVDSILIDEARTPLIISAPAEESGDLYAKFATFVHQLVAEQDYQVNEKERFVSLTDEGIQKMERSLGVENIYDERTVQYVHHLEEALKAKALFQRDKDYVVKDGEVIIVDEFTGRLMPGRRYSEGLHQAIEAKEGVEVRQESRTLATITFQNLFRMYGKLSGMTGTAETEAEEFAKIYHLDVLAIPTHRDVVREDRSDLIYKTEAAKFAAIVGEVKRLREAGRPVLVGTASIEKSERLSKLLKQAGIDHDVLNAKQHEREAKIIESAGEPGRVTVATNMAGRGVDILLGGRKPGEAASPADLRAWEACHQAVLEAGGLAVVGSERHESRRIDNQLRGRAGRQGDPGSSQFYVSMEDDLMRIFGGERMRQLMDRLGLPDDEAIQHRLVANSIEQAQKRVEGHNFDIRKHLVEYDDVMNQHREVIYRKRQKIVGMDPVKEAWLHEEIEELLHEDELGQFQAKVQQVGAETFRKLERLVYLRTIDSRWMEHLGTMQHLREGIGLKGYAQKDPLVEYKDAAFGLFERLKDDIENQIVEMLLKLEIKDQVPADVSGGPQKLQLQGADPSLAGGGFQLVRRSAELAGSPVPAQPTQSQLAVSKVAGRLARSASKSQLPAVIPPTSAEVVSAQPAATGITVKVRERGKERAIQAVGPAASAVTPYAKVGRNDPCPCGSGKKFKKCHGQ
ncbi:preprotein translocase subunit SecA [Candidatus Berkelbacteria bacterium]|nr:preprotein translocase subunit SecA [Candidatus Berkelbacteria bacterium]